MGNQDFWDEARWAWGDRTLPDEEAVRLSKLPCLGCARAYPHVKAPLFVRPCACGEWHRVCFVCVLDNSLTTSRPTPSSAIGRFGPLNVCPYPVRVANELMGDVEDYARRSSRAQKELDFAKNYGTGPEIKVPNLRVRVTRLH